MGEIRRNMSPEFINRLDDTVIFHRLKYEHMDPIIDIQLRNLRAALADRHIHVELEDSARTFLASHGFDPAYGARPLKRAVQVLC